jgi:Fic-DOC domain mobile mystery protein B
VSDEDPHGGDAAATKLTPEERVGLIPTWITTRDDLNRAERANIASGQRWARRGRLDVLDPDTLFRLHRRMFADVWRWAGQPRGSEKNIGVAPHLIEVQLHQLLGDARYWVEHGTYAADEIAVRFHHRLVAIHPFANGNGRHARLAADLLVSRLGRPVFTWGGANLAQPAQIRRDYVRALKAADGADIGPLLAFARA